MVFVALGPMPGTVAGIGPQGNWILYPGSRIVYTVSCILYPVSCILLNQFCINFGSMLDHMSLDLGLDLDLDLELNLDFVISRDGFATPASVWVRSGAQNSSESSVFG